MEVVTAEEKSLRGGLKRQRGGFIVQGNRFESRRVTTKNRWWGEGNKVENTKRLSERFTQQVRDGTIGMGVRGARTVKWVRDKQKPDSRERK